MNRQKKTGAIGAGLVMCGAAALMTAGSASAQPVSYVPCSAGALSAAITAANASGGGGLLPDPGCACTLSAPAAAGDGLPPAISHVSIPGAGAAIARSAAAPAFRVFDVTAQGTLSLTGLTAGGGSAPAGGGILNAGTLTPGAFSATGDTAAGTGGGSSAGSIENSGVLWAGAGRITADQAVTAGAGIHTAAVRAGGVDGDSVTGAGALDAGILNDAGTVGIALGTAGSNSGAFAGGPATAGGVMHAGGTTVAANHAGAAPGGILTSGGTLTLALSAVFGSSPANCAGSPSPVPGCLN